MGKEATLQPIQITPGVQPVTDMTAVATNHYIASDKIRSFNGFPEKIGGWIGILFDYGQTIAGTVRSLYTDFINGKYYTVVGSNEKLYSLIGSRLTNITPLLTTSVTAANSLSTHYDTLINNPIEATLGELFVWVQDVDAANYQVGDTIYLSGATSFAGIPAPSLNGDFLVRETGTGEYKIYTGVAANATVAGGGAAVVRSSGLVTLSSAAHGNLDGERVKISGATDTGGILAAEINLEFIIRNVLPNSFDFMTIGEATSSVSSAGGAGTEYFEEIPDGLVNETTTQGYGAGFYGFGLYGTALLSTASRSYPRIWFDDRYADTIVLTPGNQTGLYQWQGTSEVAPALIPNAPTAVNYTFVSNNIIVTLGAGGIENRVFASDNTDITVWTSSSTNQVFDDDIEGAGRLTSHCPVKDYNLIFTEFKTYKFRYIGLPFVWEITAVDETIGLIAPMARCSVKGVAYWMGQENFYMFRGGSVEVIPANTQDQCTALNYVFQNLNQGQKSKIFAWYNKRFNEVWFHYPDASSNEPNRVIRVNLLTFEWWTDTLDRTAAEYPNTKLVNPRLINVGLLYQHEYGTDADGEPMEWSITSNRRYYSKDTVNVLRIVPDNFQDGDITFTSIGYLFPQSVTPMQTLVNNFEPITEKLETGNNARFYEFTWNGSELGQAWRMGQWFEELQKGATE